MAPQFFSRAFVASSIPSARLTDRVPLPVFQLQLADPAFEPQMHANNRLRPTTIETDRRHDGILREPCTTRICARRPSILRFDRAASSTRIADKHPIQLHPRI
jgi:hypothetical protein